MLAIKLRQIGKKHQHTFRIIVAEKRSKVSGDCVEDLGFWNPHANSFEVNNERVTYWMNHGAQPTDTVHNLLIRAKAIEGKKIAKHKIVKKVEEAPKAEAAAQPAV